MKTFNKTLIAAATITTFGLAAAPAAVSLEASASLATSYLWRGLELGEGSAALAVDLSGSTGAVSYGLWVSSGDGSDTNEDGTSGAGSTEYDIYASYSGEVNGIGYTLGYASYNYPTLGVGFDDAAEYIYGLSYGPASVTRFDEKDGDGEYTVVGYEAGAFSFAYGDHDAVDRQHFDVSYAVNDSLSVTVSKLDDADATVVATYSLPF